MYDRAADPTADACEAHTFWNLMFRLRLPPTSRFFDTIHVTDGTNPRRSFDYRYHSMIGEIQERTLLLGEVKPAQGDASEGEAQVFGAAEKYLSGPNAQPDQTFVYVMVIVGAKAKVFRYHQRPGERHILEGFSVMGTFPTAGGYVDADDPDAAAYFIRAFDTIATELPVPGYLSRDDGIGGMS